VTASAADYAVEVLPPPPITARPGEFITRVFTVTNQGTLDDVYTLRVTTPPGWLLLGLPGELALGAGESAKVFISVLVPAEAAAGEYELILWATSQADPTVSAEGVCIIEVVPAAGVRVLPPPGEEVIPGETVTYAFIVENTGNVPDTFALEARSSRGYPVEVSPTTLSLPFGERGGVRVRLQVPEDARPGVDRLTLRATSTVHPGVSGEGSVLTRILPPPPEAVPDGLIWTLPSEVITRALLTEPLRVSAAEVDLRSSGRVPGLLNLDLYVEDLTAPQSAGFTLTLRPDPPGPLALGLSKTPQSLELRCHVGLPGGGLGLSLLQLLQTPAYKVSGSLSLGVNNFALSGSGEMSDVAGVVDYAQRLELSWRADPLLLKARLFRIGPEFWGGGKDTQGVLGALSLSGMGLPFSFWASHELTADNVERTLPKTTATVVTRLAAGLSSAETSVNLYHELAKRISDDWPPTVRTRDRETRVGLTGSLGTAVLSFTYTYGRLFDGGQKDDDGDTAFDEDWVNGVDDDLDGRTDEDPPNIDSFDVTSFGLGLKIGLEGLYGWAGFAQEEVRIAPDNDDDGLVDEDPIDGVDNDGDCLGDTNNDGSVCGPGDIGVDEDGPAGAGFDDGQIKDRAFRAYLGLGYSTGAVSGSLVLTLEEERVSLGFGVGAGLTPDVTLSLSSSVGVHTLTGERSFAVLLSLAGRFDLPTPFAVKGRIEGHLFVDADGDGRYDPDEEGVPNVIIIADGTEVLTGADGLFRFPPFWPGWYAIRLEELPAGLIPAIELPVRVKLEAGEVKEVDLPLRRVAAIEGLVFEDADRDGVRDETERGLPRVRVTLTFEGAQLQAVWTNPQGRFSFINLEPGEYLVRLDTTTLPERYEPTTPAEVRVELAAGELEWVEFGAAERERPLVIGYSPVAEFTFSPERPEAGETVTFDASASYDPDGEIVRYEWDFDNDGTVDATGKIVEWVFPEPGTYPVKLTVTDNDGFRSSVTKEVPVG